MCGLFATTQNKKLLKYYKEQASRGREGFGVISIKKDNTVKVDRFTKEGEFENYLRGLKRADDNKLTLAHHRFPTSSENWLSQTHPIFVEHADFRCDYYVMHNGVISNDRQLKVEQEKEGFEYDTLITLRAYSRHHGVEKEDSNFKWNDSNALAIELAKFIEGKVEDINQVRGSYAFLVVAVLKGTNILDKVYFGRNSGNPLKWNSGQAIGSQVGSIEVLPGTLWSLNVDTFAFTVEKDFTDNSLSRFDYGKSGGYNASKNTPNVSVYDPKKLDSKTPTSRSSGYFDDDEDFEREVGFQGSKKKTGIGEISAMADQILETAEKNRLELEVEKRKQADKKREKEASEELSQDEKEALAIEEELSRNFDDEDTRENNFFEYSVYVDELHNKQAKLHCSKLLREYIQFGEKKLILEIISIYDWDLDKYSQGENYSFENYEREQVPSYEF